jgi:integrase
MASIWKHPRSPFWTACWRDADGKQRRVSTKTSNRNLARSIAREFELSTRKKRTLNQVEKVLRAFREELCGETARTRSLRVFCEEWLSEKEQSVAPSTVKFYRGTLAKLLRHFGAHADEPITQITRADLIAFRAGVAAQVSPTTANHVMIGVKALFAAARSAGRVAEDPSEFIKPMREDPDKGGRRPFTVTELQVLLANVDREWQSMIRLGFYTGARLSDVASLKWADIDFDRSELRFVARKTRKNVLVPITGPLKTHLMDLASNDGAGGYVHPRAAEIMTRRGNPSALSAAFAGLLESAGLRTKHPRTKGTRRHNFDPLSFHSLRHTFVSLLKDGGAAVATVMEMSGHSSAAMSELYTHTDRSSMERAIQMLPTL